VEETVAKEQIAKGKRIVKERKYGESTVYKKKKGGGKCKPHSYDLREETALGGNPQKCSSWEGGEKGRGHRKIWGEVKKGNVGRG